MFKQCFDCLQANVFGQYASRIYVAKFMYDFQLKCTKSRQKTKTYTSSSSGPSSVGPHLMKFILLASFPDSALVLLICKI